MTVFENVFFLCITVLTLISEIPSPSPPNFLHRVRDRPRAPRQTHDNRRRVRRTDGRIRMSRHRRRRPAVDYPSVHFSSWVS